VEVQHVFFAGGGTGGHIYPALAVAQQLVKIRPGMRITFFCSDRPIDADILTKSGFDFVPLPATGFSAHPVHLIKFIAATYKSYRNAKAIIAAYPAAAMVGVGGFVSTGPVLAAHKLGIPTFMLNTDSVPGKANRFLAGYVDAIFAQFELSRGLFGKAGDKVVITGCPLRPEFADPDRNAAFKDLGLDPAKRVLLVTGASTGAKTINQTIGALLDKLGAFSDGWQIVHLSGNAEYESVNRDYAGCRIAHKIVNYYDGMASLLAAGDLVIGRAGAVSVAEFAAVGLPSICMPYPFHKDNHQRLNAEQLEKAGCCVIVDDKIDAAANAAALWPHLQKLMSDPAALEIMRLNARKFGISNAAADIAKRILTR
jgi:UDP-N-acetylglucosamine--N-acetylmuramyl-(pentapeptide) pyrophosphoryl-undecaprenol N-acetylglucosamine transferase